MLALKTTESWENCWTTKIQLDMEDMGKINEIKDLFQCSPERGVGFKTARPPKCQNLASGLKVCFLLENSKRSCPGIYIFFTFISKLLTAAKTGVNIGSSGTIDNSLPNT